MFPETSVISIKETNIKKKLREKKKKKKKKGPVTDTLDSKPPRSVGGEGPTSLSCLPTSPAPASAGPTA